MKKLLIIVTITLAIFFFGTSGYSDILKDLEKFQQSLGDWVTQIGELNNRISRLEGDKASQEKQMAEINQSINNIESMLGDMDAKVERVANMSSLKGIKEIVKSFEGTLDVFKKRFAELSNRVEDQEVKTAVLERMYKTANKPLDTLMQALDEQKSVIDKLGGKLESQEQLILSMKEGLQKQTSSEASFAMNIEEMNDRLRKLESGVLVQAVTEQGGKHKEEQHAAAPAEHHEAPGGEQHAAAPAEHHEIQGEEQHAAVPAEQHETQAEEQHAAAPAEHHEESQEPAQHSDLIDIGEGFSVKNITFKPFGSSSRMQGKIVNNSDRNYGMTDFEIQTFDKNNVPLGKQEFSAYGLRKGASVPFEEIIVGVRPKEISKYAIYPSQMPLVSDTGESIIKIIEIEKTETAAQVETKEKGEASPENLEDLIFEKQAPPAELKGFESVGNGFYIGNVSFKGFGSSSTVTGNIKNSAEKDFYNASFVMKVFSKSYGMITSLDFSVRNINRGDTKPFEEIIAGVQPVDIDRYEVSFKTSSY